MTTTRNKKPSGWLREYALAAGVLHLLSRVRFFANDVLICVGKMLVIGTKKIKKLVRGTLGIGVRKTSPQECVPIAASSHMNQDDSVALNVCKSLAVEKTTSRVNRFCGWKSSITTAGRFANAAGERCFFHFRWIILEIIEQPSDGCCADKESLMGLDFIFCSNSEDFQKGVRCV